MEGRQPAWTETNRYDSSDARELFGLYAQFMDSLFDSNSSVFESSRVNLSRVFLLSELPKHKPQHKLLWTSTLRAALSETPDASDERAEQCSIGIWHSSPISSLEIFECVRCVYLPKSTLRRGVL